MKTILVTAQKGGVGKSTLAMLLASSLCNHHKVGVLDYDNQGSFLSHKSDIEDFYNFKIFSTEDIDHDDSLLEDLDFLIIDTPPFNIKDLSMLIDASDFICVPTKLAELDVSSVITTLERIEQMGAKDKTLLIPSMVNPSVNYSEIYEVIDMLGFKRVENNIFNFVGLSKLFVSYTPLNANAKEKTTKAINELINYINN